MSWDLVASVGISTLYSVSVLFIATIGLAVVFGLMGIINLAHGEFIMMGAYVTLYATKAGIPFPVSVLLAGIALAVFGVVVERCVIQFLYGRLLDSLLATWGLSMVLLQGAVLIFGSSTSGIGLPQSFIRVGRFTFSTYSLVLMAAAVVLAMVVYLVFTKTKYGVLSRAAIQNETMATALGINTKRLNVATFAFGSALAGIAGGLLVPAFPATPDMGSAFVSKAFLAVIVAGPLALSGTVASVFGLESLSSLVSNFFTSVLGIVSFFVITIVALRFFPNGISRSWRGKL